MDWIHEEKIDIHWLFDNFQDDIDVMNNLQAKEIIAEARYSKNRGKHCKDFGRKWSPDVKTNLMVKMLMEWNVWVVDDPPPFLYE
uniref:Ovule protein n=2 Tax=Bursaphelenchus xylophilus TaxID=6326 RepID=A0A1I7SPF6_BURXY